MDDIILIKCYLPLNILNYINKPNSNETLNLYGTIKTNPSTECKIYEIKVEHFCAKEIVSKSQNVGILSKNSKEILSTKNSNSICLIVNENKIDCQFYQEKRQVPFRNLKCMLFSAKNILTLVHPLHAYTRKNFFKTFQGKNLIKKIFSAQIQLQTI